MLYYLSCDDDYLKTSTYFIYKVSDKQETLNVYNNNNYPLFSLDRKSNPLVERILIETLDNYKIDIMKRIKSNEAKLYKLQNDLDKDIKLYEKITKNPYTGNFKETDDNVNIGVHI